MAHPGTILIADDSSSIRNILKIYLMGLPVEVIDVDSGERALELARRAPPSLIIVDINMPGMDGLTMVDRLRRDERPEVARVPVVVLTGDQAEHLALRAKEVGANEFLQKPISAGDLIRVCSPYLTRELAGGAR
jgi:CheY-like chemotaxis protein